MGMTSWVHWVVVGLVILLLFGKGRFSSMMGDVAQGIKSFKKGMAEEDEASAAPKTLTRDAQPHGGHVVDVSPAPRPEGEEARRP